jgi:DNA invertase Pin-like site-specific DNA recombinase
MRIGYARVSGQDQCTDLQLDALKAAGCEKIFTEKASGAQRDRPELKAVLEYMRDDGSDVLVVWKLDRLARSLRQLIETVEDLEKRGIGFESLTERIDTTSAAGRLTFHIFACMAEFERSIGRERNPSRFGGKSRPWPKGWPSAFPLGEGFGSRKGTAR